MNDEEKSSLAFSLNSTNPVEQLNAAYYFGLNGAAVTPDVVSGSHLALGWPRRDHCSYTTRGL